MVGRTLSIWSNQESVELQYSSASMIFKLNTKFMFGHNFAKSLEKISEKLTKSKPSAFSFPLNIPGTEYHNFVKKKLKDSFRNMIKERRNSTGTSDGPGDLLDHAIADTQIEQFLTEELVVNLMFAVFYASFDTISTGITLIVDFISAHPSVLDESLAEHGAILERREDARHTLNWDEYRSMKFTHQVINEALRLGNIAFGLLRRVLKDIQMNGFTIPAGWVILLVHSAPHFDADTYEDPLIFNPWHWKELDSSEISKTFRPFGGGTRQCAGAEYAKAVLAVFMHVLVTKYRWTKVRGQVVYNPMVGFGEGVHIKVSDRT
ncbi:cucurbitadienol 11-hydroxylase-like [Syzygium oleosum]|uniref:cucurbitadienol 11-hydroxylase-like n=1 Tax=Syzygium oleosum TaxID=219896 RepID=UPI0024BBC149|nr:cucurbitadienol 11-hydroxylase-like [Syzygium oleosum]